MKRYLFLLAWASGSDSNCGEDNDIHHVSDLLSQYKLGNDSVFALEIIAPNIGYAYDKGIAEAFFDGYSFKDSCSDIVKIDDDFEHPRAIRKIELS